MFQEETLEQIHPHYTLVSNKNLLMEMMHLNLDFDPDYLTLFFAVV